MAHLTREQLQEIVNEQKPGYEIIDIDDGDSDAEPDVDRAPDLAELRRRYLGEDAAADVAGTVSADGGVATSGAEETDDEDIEVVVLAPKDKGADPWGQGPGPKTVVVSGRDRHIVAEQG